MGGGGLCRFIQPKKDSIDTALKSINLRFVAPTTAPKQNKKVGYPAAGQWIYLGRTSPHIAYRYRDTNSVF